MRRLRRWMRTNRFTERKSECVLLDAKRLNGHYLTWSDLVADILTITDTL